MALFPFSLPLGGLLDLLLSSFSCVTLSFPPLPPRQKYVQDALREQLSERVYQCLREEGGHIYVCGDVTMAGDVLKNVQQIIKQEGNMSLEEAGLFISKLRVRQTWPVMLMFTPSLPLVVVSRATIEDL